MISAQVWQAGEPPLSQPAREITRKPTNVLLPTDLNSYLIVFARKIKSNRQIWHEKDDYP